MAKLPNALVTRGFALALISLATACNGGQAPAENGTTEPEPAVTASPAAPPVAATPSASPTPTASPEATPAAGQAGALEISDADVEAQLSPAFDACLNSGDAAKGVTPAMAACVQAELKLQDDRLNGAYTSAMAKRGPTEQARLRTEERAWIKRRDAECREQATGGTIDRVEIPMCLLHETVRRRITLQPMAG